MKTLSTSQMILKVQRFRSGSECPAIG